MSINTLGKYYSRQFQATIIYTDGSREVVTSRARWTSSNTTVATIRSNRGLKSGEATGLATGTTNITAQYAGFTTQPAPLTVFSLILPKKLFAYVTNQTANTVSYCPINSDGTLGICNTTGSGFNTPRGITINPAGTYAYIANDATPSTISVCIISAIDGSLTSCTNLPLPNAIDTPSSVFIDAAQGENLYVANLASPLVYKCPLNVNNGSFVAANCSEFINVPMGAQYGFDSLTMDSGNTKFYLSVLGSTSVTLGNIMLCEAQGNINDPSGCNMNALMSNNYYRNIAMSATEPYAYLANFSATTNSFGIQRCRYSNVGFNKGALSSCVQAVGDIDGWQTRAIAFSTKNPANFYVTSLFTNSVFYCAVGANSHTPTCTSVASGFSYPSGIAITP